MSPLARVRGITVFTHPGQRSVQEDFVLTNQEKGIFVVADGFGGASAGARAAQTACESVKKFLEHEARDAEATLPFVLRSYISLAGNVLFNAILFANQKILGLNKSKGVHEKGGSSVIAGYLDGDLLSLANVGGCTAWLGRGGRTVELVVPRTYGKLKDPFARDCPQEWSAPLTALGISEDLEPEIMEVQIHPGDWLMLHSDGLGSETRDRVFEVQGQGGGRLGDSELAESIDRLLRSVQLPGSDGDNSTLALIMF